MLGDQYATSTVEQLAEDLRDPGTPTEINRLGCTLQHWRTQISNWYYAQVSNGPTEAANNLLKRIKRVGSHFTNFGDYRIRMLL
ncbi:MAG: transposase [Acidimicrobiaceae bacterium]|nr:transposase [Acidimicrobiaceae bacterium]